MIDTYTAKDGQSIYDVCLNTYGTLNLLFKLIKDNKISSTNEQRLAGKVFTFDTSLIIDNSIFNVVNNAIVYATQEKYGVFLQKEDRFYLLKEDGFKIII